MVDALQLVAFRFCVRCPRAQFRTMSVGSDRYQMAVRLGEIMEELEQQDHAAGDELNPVPSWIRAHFVLEQEFEQINARQQELEAAMSDADNQRMQARPSHGSTSRRLPCQTSRRRDSWPWPASLRQPTDRATALVPTRTGEGHPHLTFISTEALPFPSPDALVCTMHVAAITPVVHDTFEPDVCLAQPPI